MTRQYGFSLTELMIALALSSLLLLGIVQLFTASSRTFSVQQATADLAQEGQFALSAMEAAVSSAGFRPDPWTLPGFSAIGDDSAEGGDRDRIHLIRLSDANCFGSENPVPDTNGNPAFHLRQEWFHLDDDRRLRWRCEYADPLNPGAGIVQANNLSLAEQVEQFQLLFGEDTDDDRIVDRWVRAGGWNHPARILAVKAGLVLRADIQTAGIRQPQDQSALSGELILPGDGRLRRSFTATWPIRSALP